MGLRQRTTQRIGSEKAEALVAWRALRRKGRRASRWRMAVRTGRMRDVGVRGEGQENKLQDDKEAERVAHVTRVAPLSHPDRFHSTKQLRQPASASTQHRFKVMPLQWPVLKAADKSHGPGMRLCPGHLQPIGQAPQPKCIKIVVLSCTLMPP